MPEKDSSGRAAASGQAEPAVDRLVSAARDMFAERGFVATSLDDVTAAAGVTKGSLYHHFGTKTELFAAAFETDAQRLFDRVVAVLDGQSDPWEAARAGIDAFLTASQEPGLQRIMFVDGPSVLGWDGVRDIESRFGLALIGAALEQLRAAGEIDEHDISVLSHLLFAALIESALLITRSDSPAEARHVVEREIGAIVDGLAIRRSS